MGARKKKEVDPSVPSRENPVTRWAVDQWWSLASPIFAGSSLGRSPVRRLIVTKETALSVEIYWKDHRGQPRYSREYVRSYGPYFKTELEALTHLRDKKAREVQGAEEGLREATAELEHVNKLIAKAG